MARETLIHVSGPMIQEEALQNPLKLDVAEFIALNGWLEKWISRDILLRNLVWLEKMES